MSSLAQRALYWLEDLALRVGILFIEVSLWAQDRRLPLPRHRDQRTADTPEDPDVTVH